MITKPPWSSRYSAFAANIVAQRGLWQVPAALALLSALLLEPRVMLALRFDRAAIAGGQWWRLLTGNFVHLSAGHWLLNALALAIYVPLCGEILPLRAWGARLLVMAAAVGAGLFWCVPGLAFYVGLSGIIYGLFFLGLGRQAWHGDRIAAVCLCFLLGRMWWEFGHGIPLAEQKLIGGSVVPESHVFGVLGAVVYALGASIVAVGRRRGRHEVSIESNLAKRAEVKRENRT